MISGLALNPALFRSGCRFENGPRLHRGDFRELDAQAAAAESEHGV
jgi:hypothetical protein